jgi:hypothetical protein
MADDKRKSPRASSGARRSRRAPTIDLTATEIRAAAAPDPEPEREPEVEREPGPVQQDAASSAAPPLSSNAKDAPASAAPSRPLWGYAAAGLLGGAVAVLAIGAFLALNPPPRPDNDLARVQAELTTLQAQVRAVSEAKPAAADSTSAERLASAENAVKAAGIALAALTKRTDEIAASAAAARERADAAAKSAAALTDTVRNAPAPVSRDDIEPLQARLAALEKAAKTTQEKVAQSNETDAAARLAVATMTLRDAVAAGGPYSAELAAAGTLGADAKAITALKPYAASGMPQNGALLRELSALLPELLKASDADLAASGGFIERLQANAAKLVRVRPIEASAGEDPAAVFSRIEVDVAQNNLAAARAEVAKLPEKARAVATDWMARVDARNAALDASRTLAAEAARALQPR